jgi:predicted metal-dependent hydrolase
MYHDYTYEAVLASSLRAQWKLDDVLRADQELDFSRNFLPESLARTAIVPGLSADEQRTLNQISAHQYLHLFGTVEEFILPFLMDHARPMLREDDFRVRALLNFACEEAKHIHLFKRYCEAFVRGFPVTCVMVGPPERLTADILRHDPLAVGLTILMIEWMTQQHYLQSIKDDADIDPLFRRLLKYHWMEEAQHAKLDTLIVDAIAEGRSEQQLNRVTAEFFQIGAYLDTCLKIQAGFNVDALERAIGRRIENRDWLIAQQHQTARWTYLGTGVTHERFKATLHSISPRMAATVANAAARLWPRMARADAEAAVAAPAALAG